MVCIFLLFDFDALFLLLPDPYINLNHILVSLFMMSLKQAVNTGMTAQRSTCLLGKIGTWHFSQGHTETRGGKSYLVITDHLLLTSICTRDLSLIASSLSLTIIIS